MYIYILILNDRAWKTPLQNAILSYISSLHVLYVLKPVTDELEKNRKIFSNVNT